MRARGRSRHAVLLIGGLLILVAPGSATAATVVNGDFESGTLSGWHVRDSGFGNWFAYKGTDAPIGHQRGADPVQAPPQGAYAAIADQADPDTLILYQDIALEPGSSYRLSLLAYYNSYEPIAIPTPDTLSVNEAELGGQSNQQYRIDVMKPNAPIESLDPADILRTLFRNESGDPLKMPPTRLTADLSPFAGQTVRLRIANAVHEEVFNAGVDAVSIFNPSSPHAPSHGSSRFGFGKAKVNRRDGTAILPVRVPGPGLLRAKGKSIVPPSAVPRARKIEKFRKSIESATAKAAEAGTVSIRLKPTPFARTILKQKHKLRVNVTVTYTPTGGSPETASLPVMLKLKARSRGRH
jgi:hypothetical protein